MRVSFVLNWVRFEILSNSLIPKYCSRNPPPLPLGAETDTILKTKKPLGRGDRRLDPWNEKDHMTVISHEQKVTTTRFVRLCILSRVLLVHRRQRNNNWTQQKNRESFAFTVQESHFAISCFKDAPIWNCSWIQCNFIDRIVPGICLSGFVVVSG